MYSNSAIGDLRAGAGSAGETAGNDVDDDEGATSSSTSVTTNPLAVISLFRVIRL